MRWADISCRDSGVPDTERLSRNRRIGARIARSIHVTGACSLHPRKRTFAEAAWMSAKCQKRTWADKFDGFADLNHFRGPAGSSYILLRRPDGIAPLRLTRFRGGKSVSGKQLTRLSSQPRMPHIASGPTLQSDRFQGREQVACHRQCQSRHREDASCHWPVFP